MSKLFWAMLAFISRLPVPSRWSQGLDFEQYSRGIVMFPFIGLILGGVSGLIFILLQPWCGIPLAALFCILALALIFVLLTKILVVSELALRGTPMLAALAVACAAGRGSAVLLMYRHRYAREEGLGNVFIGKVSGRQTCITLGLAIIIATVLLPGMQGLAAMVVTCAAIFILGQLLKRTLGGQTGDTLGAAIELGELIFLLALL
ncbi:adenosylcobinamide-GDP ribazoletransferase [Salmonella enterica]|nr:adenosylcobinamide-GDP ribazoletransferase [Salmonella enterica]